MTLMPVHLVQVALAAVAAVGLALTVSQPRLRALSALLVMSLSWMVFNFLEETAGFRNVWLVTPAFRLAYPPLIYLVVRGVIRTGPALTWRDWPHAVAPLLALLLTPQIGLVEHAARISLLAYSVAAIWQIHRFHRATRQTRSDAQVIQLNGLMLLVGFYFVDSVFDAVRMDALWLRTHWPWLGSQDAYLFQLLLSLVFVSVLIFLAVRHTRLFEGLPPGGMALEAGAGGPDEAVSDTQRADFRRVEAVVRGEALYTEPRLLRSEVAQAAGLSERAVSQVIKAATGCNFNDYINRLRIEDVCAMMREDAVSGTQRRVIDLAYTAGFSSKSVFNDVFKRETGQTPSAYAAGLAGDAAG
jgi:AraC-like DNA-binding protein